VSILDHPAPVTTRSSCCSRCETLADENAHLRRELNTSRARILQACDGERRRLERNLHDGAQQRLVALSLQLRLLASRLALDAESAGLLDAVREELQASLGELRELAHGLHPAVLSDHGLAVALESLAVRAPMEVTLTVDLDERVELPVEAASYYVVAEALTNVAKYAHATHASVTVRRSQGNLLIAIDDDGIGGADPLAGSGLRGLADRVEALGGRLSVASCPGDGTTIAATIPTPR
jgi:signal transduction histidine kinase